MNPRYEFEGEMRTTGEAQAMVPRLCLKSVRALLRQGVTTRAGMLAHDPSRAKAAAATKLAALQHTGQRKAFNRRNGASPKKLPPTLRF